MECNKANSASKSMAPIFNLSVVYPSCSFSSICACIKSTSPIQIKPLIGILRSPVEKLLSKRRRFPPLSKSRRAVSKPNLREGHSFKSCVGSSHRSSSFFVYSSNERKSGESPGMILHSPIPTIQGASLRQTESNQACFCVSTPRLVPPGRLKLKVFFSKRIFMQSRSIQSSKQETLRRS